MVFTSNDKPIKFVTEGSIFEVGTVTERADRTIDMFAAERYDLAIVLNQYYGQFRIGANYIAKDSRIKGGFYE